jgi:hypothetical protein
MIGLILTPLLLLLCAVALIFYIGRRARLVNQRIDQQIDDALAPIARERVKKIKWDRQYYFQW